ASVSPSARRKSPAAAVGTMKAGASAASAVAPDRRPARASRMLKTRSVTIHFLERGTLTETAGAADSSPAPAAPACASGLRTGAAGRSVELVRTEAIGMPAEHHHRRVRDHLRRRLASRRLQVGSLLGRVQEDVVVADDRP